MIIITLITIIARGGGVAELVARPPTVPKVRGSNHGADLCFIRALFIGINDGREVSNYTYVSYGFGTSNHFEMIQHVEICSHFEPFNRL
jgi:hypothetical protein